MDISPLLTHSSTLKITSPMRTPSLSRFDQSVKDMNFGPFSHKYTSLDTPVSSPSSDRLGTPASERAEGSIERSEDEASAGHSHESLPAVAKPLPSPRRILGQLYSLDLLHSSSAFEDPGTDNDNGSESDPDTSSLSRALRSSADVRVKPLDPCQPQPGLFVVRAQTEPLRPLNAAIGLVRRRGESLSSGTKLPFLRRSLPGVAFESKTGSGIHDTSEDPLDMLVRAATGHDDPTWAAERSVSPEHSKAQALAHRLGLTSTSRLRTTVSRMTIPSSPTTRDEWDTDTDDYAPRPTPHDRRPNVHKSQAAPAASGSDKGDEEHSVASEAAGLDPLGLSNHGDDCDDRDDKQSVLAAIRK